MSKRHFGIMTDGTGLGGQSERQPRPLPRDAITIPRDSLHPFPSRSVLKPIEVFDPPVNKFKLIENAALFVITAAALFGFFVLLFVEVH
jgi:hypothetical protein